MQLEQLKESEEKKWERAVRKKKGTETKVVNCSFRKIHNSKAFPCVDTLSLLSAGVDTIHWV